jgi:hypothetical protein
LRGGFILHNQNKNAGGKLRRRVKFVRRSEADAALRALLGDFLFTFPDGQPVLVSVSESWKL